MSPKKKRKINPNWWPACGKVSWYKKFSNWQVLKLNHPDMRRSVKELWLKFPSQMG